ncbi:MAG: hypothetical protein Q4C81_01645 [Kocuria sp.]|nr:hypothetical protein [Kocuria sp.]
MVHADASGDPNAEPAPRAETHVDPPRTETLMYRRAPKVPVFLTLGATLGAVVGLFAGVVGAGNPMFTTGQVVGYMIAIFALVGFSVGAIVALLLDRMSLARSQQLQARVEQHRGTHTSDNSEKNDMHTDAPTSGLT